MSTSTWPAQLAEAMQEVRKALAPQLGDPNASAAACRQCGTEFWRWKGESRVYCSRCAAQRQIASGDHMRARSGPAYERAVLGQLRHWVGEAERLGLITPGPLGDPNEVRT